MDSIKNFPKADLQLLFDCMFGEDGVFIKLLDNPQNDFSIVLYNHLKSYYKNDFANIPLNERIKYLSYFGHFRLGMGDYHNPYFRTFVNIFFNTTPDNDLLKVVDVFDKENRMIYDKLKLFGGKDFVNNVYSKVKRSCDNHIPLSKRKVYLWYYSNLDEVYEPEEFIVIDLIERTPINEVKSLFEFMKNNDMFRKFGSVMDNFWGADNLDKFAEVLHKKWIDAGGSDEEYLEMTKQYFINPLWRNRALAHLNFSVGAQAGLVLTGVNASISFGFGFDTYGNIAFFGNANIFAYLLNKGFQFNKISDLCYKSFNEAINDYKNWNILSGIGIGADVSLNIDLWADDIRALLGLGTTRAVGINVDGLNFEMLFNYDGDDNFIGIGFHLLTKGKSKSLPISYQKISETNRGLIFNLSDIPLLKDCKFDAFQKSKPSYDIMDGKLVIKSWLGTIKTGIGAKWDDIIKKNFVITNGCKFLINE